MTLNKGILPGKLIRAIHITDIGNPAPPPTLAAN